MELYRGKLDPDEYESFKWAMANVSDSQLARAMTEAQVQSVASARLKVTPNDLTVVDASSGESEEDDNDDHGDEDASVTMDVDE